MLILPIKKQWYDLIKSGIKLEEYRSLTNYYLKRFQTVGLVPKDLTIDNIENGAKLNSDISNKAIIGFRNGYSAKSPTFYAEVYATIDSGNPEWGAINGEKYFVLHICKILE